MKKVKIILISLLIFATFIGGGYLIFKYPWIVSVGLLAIVLGLFFMMIYDCVSYVLNDEENEK